MRPCSVLRDGVKVSAHLVRCGPKNSRVSFNGDRDCTELVATSSVYEIMEATAKTAPTTGSSYINLCTEAVAIGRKMEAALAGAGVIAAPHMNLQEKLDGLRGLRDDTSVVVEGELWTREEAEACGAVEPSESHEEEAEAASAA